MKKIIALLSIAVLGISSVANVFAYSSSFPQVHQWMFNNGLTKYDNINEFRPADWITRGEASKFINQYAQFKGFTQNYTQCNFDDIANYDSTLVPHILEACAYGLIKGSGTKFMPNGNLTEAQALTIVMRSLYGFLNETGARRWSAYYESADYLGLITNETIDSVNTTPATREKMGTWFYVAANEIKNTDIQDLDGEEDIRELMFDIFGSIEL